ncbi:transposase, partial [Shigella boydii]|uniref:transposase n=1 Tax=Shigella boydii TaxID=621 RepID=UPI002092CB7A
MTGTLLGLELRKRKTPQEKIAIIQQTMEPSMTVSHVARLHGIQPSGFAPIFPDICYHLTHYKPAAADIPVASDNPA